MEIRIGRVTNAYPTTGKLKVTYEDEKNTSLPLSMLTMNGEYAMPALGDRVLTLHMENGSSKGFVLGTYYGGDTIPKANSGYRKDFGGNAYVVCKGGTYSLFADAISLESGSYRISLGQNAELLAESVLIESDDSQITVNTDIELQAAGSVTIESEGGTAKISNADASITVASDLIIQASNIQIQGNSVTLQCSYGTITVEDIIKRLEQLEARL